MTIETQKVFISIIDRVKFLNNNDDKTLIVTVGGIGSGIEFRGSRGKGIRLRAIKNSSKFKHLYAILPTYIFVIIKSESINEYYKIPNAKILDANIETYKV